jgi:hypothetical protein
MLDGDVDVLSFKCLILLIYSVSLIFVVRGARMAYFDSRIWEITSRVISASLEESYIFSRIMSAEEVAPSKFKSSESGGTVNGVPWACPK